MSSYVNLNEGTSWTQTRMISNLRLGLSQHDILPQTNEPPSSYTLTKPLVDFKSPVNFIYSSIYAFVQLIHWLYVFPLCGFILQNKSSAFQPTQRKYPKGLSPEPVQTSPPSSDTAAAKPRALLSCDGRNPANLLIWRISGLFHFSIGVHMQQVVQDFFH